MISERISYWKVFRLIFSVFLLYLIGESLYRWNGYRYHSTLSEFLPSVALVTILWTIVAIFSALAVWMLLRTFKWLGLRTGWRFRITILLMFILLWISVLLGAVVYPIRYKQITLQLISGITLASIFITLLFRNKTERWMNIIQERITPLVWLFGIWVIISVPLVMYNTWGKQEVNTVSQKIPQIPTGDISIEDKSRPNIVLFTFDALTARDMSVYGYHRQTTPFISEWAKTASLFTMVEAENNYTTPTTASLMTGKRLWTHQTYHVVGSSIPVRSDIESLPLMLKKNGYYNMAFVVNPDASVKTLGVSNSFEINPLASEFWVPITNRGFIDVTLCRLFCDDIEFWDWFIDWEFIFGKLIRLIFRGDPIDVPPEEAFNRFLEVIDNNPPEPFFAWIHVFPPHDPYLPPEPYRGMFSAKLKEPEGYLENLDLPRGLYDEFIMYCDKQFEGFINQLSIRGILKNTVIILSSDHGESFEHDYFSHGGEHLYEQVTHVPLIIKEPNQTVGRVVNDLVEQIDIPPTILELANITVPPWMEGRSLVPLMQGKKLSPRPAFSMAFEKNPSRGHQINRGTIAVWEGDYKLIHYLKENKSLLFNLNQDHAEINNLFGKKPEIGNYLLALIKDNLKKANERISRENK